MIAARMTPTDGNESGVRCAVHGLAYDPTVATGCVLCRRSQTNQPKCASCGRAIDSGAPVCPGCGLAQKPRSDDRLPPTDELAGLRRRAPLYAAGLLVAGALAFFVAGKKSEQCRSFGQVE